MSTLTNQEKIKILDTLERDKEFRYAIAGLLGFREILERLDKLETNMEKLWENQEKLWMEVKALRENQEKLWENQEKLWMEVRELKRGQDKLRASVESLSDRLQQLGRAVGMTLDHYTAAFLERYLVEKGFSKETVVEVDVKLKHLGSTVEVDLFCENPLLVGEVTTYVGDVRQAEEEVKKLLEKVKFVEKMYERTVELKVLGVANATQEALNALKEASRKEDILLILGREVQTFL
ncbi:MAG: hypothetical protein RMI04_04915 [Thermofilaceae archaeon]|nr:hypothetical protein [Thermofilaceae archaeon]